MFSGFVNPRPESLHENYTNQPEWITLWTLTKAVKLVLQENHPEQYDQLLLKLLHKYCDDICNDKELLNQLKNTPWLKLSKGGSICPNQLIFLGERIQKIQNLTPVIEEAFCNESQVDYVISTQLPNSIPQEQINLLKKNKLSPTWYENDLLKFLLDKTHDPSTYCKAILYLLKSIYKNKQKISNENFEKLKQRHWLIDKSNKARSPQQIWNLPNLNDKATEILKQLSSWDYITPTLLKEGLDVNFCLEYSQLQNLFLSEKDSIPKLGDAIAQLPQYYIGNVDLELKELSQVLSNCELMPIWKIYFQVPQQQFKSDILPKVKKPVSDIEWLCKLLKWITANYKNPNNQYVIKVYNTYLKLFINSDSKSNKIKKLAELKLLNQKLEWQVPQYLCVPTTSGIDQTYLIDDEQYNIINKLLNYKRSYTPSEYQQLTNNSNEQKTNADILKEYFKDWLNTNISTPLIGLFFMLFSKYDDEIKKIAKTYFKRHSFEEFYNQLPLNLFNFNKNISFEIISDDEEILINNIFGEKIRVIKEQKPEHIFIGDIKDHIKLRKIQVNHFQVNNLENILQNSIYFLLFRVKSLEDTNKIRSLIDKQWNSLKENSKIEIETASDYIVEHSPHIFRELNIDLYDINDLLVKIETKQFEQTKLNYQNNHNHNHDDLQDIRETINNCIGQIKQTIKEKAEVKRHLLNCVRKKIKNYSYSEKSVLFELFQNADDASLERDNFLGTNDPKKSQTQQCIIASNGSEIELIHWGRPINQVSDLKLSNEQFQGKGYERDLVKMVSFNISDKTEEATGEFGLGFKTVYLLTDCPKVHSGNLSFQVNGGILPDPIRQPDEIRNLQNRIQHFQQQNQDGIDGTIIKLPISSHINNIQSIIDEFKSYTHLILAFAKKIKSCRIESDQVKTINIKWEPEKVLGIDGIECDVVQNQPTLCFQLKKGQVAITLPRKLDNEDSFLREMPTFWVTVPTKELLSLRFVVNSQFDINPGRTSFDPNSTHNQELISEIGEQLGEKLCQLFQASQGNWETLHQQLGLYEQVNSYQFWEFLWKVLAVDWLDKLDEQHKSELLYNGFGGEYHGFGHLISCHPTLPNGLYGDYRKLVCFTELAYVVTGILKQQEIFKIVSQWSQFQQHYQPDCLVHEDIWQYLQRLLRTNELESLTLQKVIEKQLSNKNNIISPENASPIGQLIEKLDSNLLPYSKEIQELHNFLSTHSISFRNQKEKYCQATSLLTPHSYDQEEQRLVQFAPSNRILDEDYNNQALNFFFKCRSQRETIEIEYLVEWAKQASTEKQKQAVRYYLLYGSDKEAFANQLEKAKRGTWMETDDGIKQLLRINVTQNRAEQANRGECSWSQVAQETPDNTDLQSDETATISNEITKINVEQFLQRLSNWWQRHYQTQLDQYNKRLYPIEIGKLKDRLKQRDREAWLILFFIGVTHTMGRISYEQCRNFVKVGMDRNWWEIFSWEISWEILSGSEPKENPEQWIRIKEWIRILDQYIDHLDNDSTWYYWMEKYPHIYQISKYLHVYQDLFLKADQFSLQSLQKLVSPRSNEQLRGGGLDAPHLSIGMGANFVLRELIRLEVIDSTPHLIPYCFVPRKQIREKCSDLGCPNLDQQNYDEISKNIYNFLKEKRVEDLTFNNSFDIAIELYWKHEY